MSEVRQAQMNKLRQMIKEHNDGGWDFAWYATKYAVWYRRIELTPLSRKSDVTPWDVGSYQPPLKEVLDDKSIGLPTSGRALVPGCGRVRRSRGMSWPKCLFPRNFFIGVRRCLHRKIPRSGDTWD